MLCSNQALSAKTLGLVNHNLASKALDLHKNINIIVTQKQRASSSGARKRPLLNLKTLSNVSLQRLGMGEVVIDILRFGR